MGKLWCRYTLQDMREYGRKKGWCPYFLARHMLAFANVMVYNYQYMLDPKVSLWPHSPAFKAALLQAQHPFMHRCFPPHTRCEAFASTVC